METDPAPLAVDRVKPFIQPAPRRHLHVLRMRAATLDPNRLANGALKNDCPGPVQLGS